MNKKKCVMVKKINTPLTNIYYYQNKKSLKKTLGTIRNSYEIKLSF